MRKIACLLCSLALLTGCSVPVWETVEDFQPSQPVSGWMETAYEIQIGLQEQPELIWETAGCKLYEAGNLEIETDVFLSSGLDSAVRRLTGYEVEQISILQTERFALPEYQFAWYSQTEEGGQMCRADLVMDGMVCYAVVCRVPEDQGNTMSEEVRQVFSGFGLSGKEAV